MLLWNNGELTLWHSPLALSALVANTILDFCLNWRFYLSIPPSPSTRHIFLSARFSTALADGTFDQDLHSSITAISAHVEQSGFKILSAHQAEEFGKKLQEPSNFVPRDRRDVCRSEALIVLLDTQLSAGVWTEVGWATAMRKPVLILRPEQLEAAATRFAEGLPSIGIVEMHNFDTLSNATKTIDGFISRRLR